MVDSHPVIIWYWAWKIATCCMWILLPLPFKYDSIYVSFWVAAGICIILRLVVGDCLMRIGRDFCPGVTYESSWGLMLWKLRQSSFPGKQFGNEISPRSTLCAMIADEAFVAPVELYLPFPHKVSILSSDCGGYGHRQLTTAGVSLLLLSRFLVVWNLQECVTGQCCTVWSLFRCCR